MELTDIFRTSYPTEAEYSFFSCAHGTFYRIYHMLGHKTNLNKFKKFEIISKIFLTTKGKKAVRILLKNSCKYDVYFQRIAFN